MFDQDLAFEFINLMALENTDAARSAAEAIFFGTGYSLAGECEICKPEIATCYCVDYNNVELANRLYTLVAGMKTAPVNVIHGELIPEFLCLVHCWYNGKTCCQSEPESPEEDPSGA